MQEWRRGFCVRRYIRPKPFFFYIQILLHPSKPFGSFSKHDPSGFAYTLQRVQSEPVIKGKTSYNFSMLIIQFATIFLFKIIILLVTFEIYFISALIRTYINFISHLNVYILKVYILYLHKSFPHGLNKNLPLYLSNSCIIELIT